MMGLVMTEDRIADDSNNIIGGNIRIQRKKKNIGQSELARKLQLQGVNITRETLVKIERGIQHIKLSQLKGICQTLKIEYKDILGETKETCDK